MVRPNRWNGAENLLIIQPSASVTFLGTWTDLVRNGTASNVLAERPEGFALINENTTVTAPWVEAINMTEKYAEFNVIINNVSMAMPHPGVMQAASDPINKLMQPEELDGLGVYNIIASVPSPVIHVLCATLNKTQLKPLVWSQWDENANQTFNASTWPAQLSYPMAYLNDTLNGTPYSEIFGWGSALDTWPPVFGDLPIDYNTVLNDTTHLPWGRQAVYLLGKGVLCQSSSSNKPLTDHSNVALAGGPTDNEGSPTNDENYALCQLQVSWTANCSTRFNASASGSTLKAVCEDPNDTYRFIESNSSAGSGSGTLSRDWPNIGGECLRCKSCYWSKTSARKLTVRQLCP